jgi:hypothetical protein
LTNQLLLQIYPEKQEYNNTANGNTNWLLEHLATFLRQGFYEYNSRPYQAFTMNAISLLHSYAMDSDLVLVADMILDVVTLFSGMQMNQLRRFVPFRRQPEYVNRTQSWAGDSEFYRLAVLVGNYGTVHGPEYVLPKSSTVNSSLGNVNLVHTIAGKYRVKDFVHTMIFRNHSGNDTQQATTASTEYFVSNHDATEMYYTTPNVLISAGGTSAEARTPPVTFPNRFCLLPSCLLNGFMLNSLLSEILTQFYEGERGWSRPTTIVPTREPSTDMMDMIRFVGHRDPDKASMSRNLCVAPNFACGLQLEYGNKIQPILDLCSIIVGDWRFLDFADSSDDPSCPVYGYYMAVYERPCDDIRCSSKADNYGVIEISENTANVSFTAFQEMVLSKNPSPFRSVGVHTYTRITGATIQFEIDPRNDDDSQIIQVLLNDRDGNDNDLMIFDRNYRTWPMAWSAKRSMQSTLALGRWTFDTESQQQRYIYDVSDAQSPKRIVSNLPRFNKPVVLNSLAITSPPFTLFPRLTRGKYFDDSESVIENDTIQRVSFTYHSFGISGYCIQWRESGLQICHGSMGESSSTVALWLRTKRVVEYELDENELIATVGIGSVAYFGIRRVHRIRMVITSSTSNPSNRTIIVGYGSTEDAVYDTTTSTDSAMIAFYGRASDEMIHELGVVQVTAGSQ